ncbi:MAG: ankyrin repeat domain-containing protein [Vicinamibacterales bacterium]
MAAEWHDAVRRGAVESLAAMFAAGADVDARDSDGLTALHVAARLGDARVAAWLAAHGAAVDDVAPDGWMPLHRAVEAGHAGVVAALVGAGASSDRGVATGGGHGVTPRERAMALGDAAVIAALGPDGPVAPRPGQPAFEPVGSWAEAAALVTFTPRVPGPALGRRPDLLRVFVRDHRGRDVPPSRRTLEARFGDVWFSQSQHTPDEARRRALDTAYGRRSVPVAIGRLDGRAFPADRDVAPDDPDGPSPAVVAWADGPMCFLLVSPERSIDELTRMAGTIGPTA